MVSVREEEAEKERTLTWSVTHNNRRRKWDRARWRVVVVMTIGHFQSFNVPENFRCYIWRSSRELGVLNFCPKFLISIHTYDCYLSNHFCLEWYLNKWGHDSNIKVVILSYKIRVKSQKNECPFCFEEPIDSLIILTLRIDQDRSG